MRRTSHAYSAVLVLLACAPVTVVKAQAECEIRPAFLPHEAWVWKGTESIDELRLRVEEGLNHWSRDSELMSGVEVALRQLQRLEPGESRNLVDLARLAMKTGAAGRYGLFTRSFDLAGGALAEALRINPESGDAWAVMARFHLKHEVEGPWLEPGAARFALGEAERLGGDSRDIAFAWAELHEIHHEYRLVIDTLEALLASEDLDKSVESGVRRRIADNYISLHRPRAAIRSVQAAVRQDPANPENWLAYSSLVLEERGDAGRAIEYARNASCLAPSRRADQVLARALYVAWAQDNDKESNPNFVDARFDEALERYPDLDEVMGYFSAHPRIASLVSVLIAAGMVPDLPDPVDDSTALQDAVLHGRRRDADRLIEFGADLDRSREGLGTPLTMAVLVGDVRMARDLIEAGANVNESMREGSALYLATTQANATLVELLLENGADPELGDDRGETPLAAAIGGGASIRIVRLLLEAGADPLHEFPPGQTILEMASMFSSPNVVELLREAAAQRTR